MLLVPDEDRYTGPVAQNMKRTVSSTDPVDEVLHLDFDGLGWVSPENEVLRLGGTYRNAANKKQYTKNAGCYELI